MSGKGPTHWLAVKNIQLSDAGKYSCIAENAKGTAWQAVNVQVHDGTYDIVPREYQEAPLFTMKPKSSRVSKGTDCLIRCTVRGIPIPRVMWFKDGNRLSSAENRYLIDTRGSGIHTLKILAVKDADHGIYSVIAESEAGEASCSATIEVEDVEPVSATFKPSVSFGPAGAQIAVPKRAVTVSAGKTARLTLEVNGYPLPEVTWYKDGVKQYTGKRYSVLEQGRNFSLKIIRIRKEDEGIYECCAINRAGIGRAVVHLTVKELQYFRNVNGPRVVIVDELKDAYLSVDVTDEKIPVIWSRDGEDVDVSSDDRFQLISSGCKRILKLCKARVRDQGEWKVSCKDQNVIVLLRVNPINPIVTAPVRTKWVCVDEELSLDAELAATATGITWILNGSDLTADNRAKSHQNGQILKLNIRPIKSTDVGILKLETDQGTAETQVNVVEAPHGLRLRKEGEGHLEARWNHLPATSFLGLYEIQLGDVSGPESIRVTWHGDGIKLEENRHSFDNLPPGFYTYRIRTTCAAFDENKPTSGPWGQLAEPTKLAAGAVLKRGLVDVEVMEGETCRMSIEVSGECRHPLWYLNGARVRDEWVTIEGETHQLVLRDLKEQGVGTVEWVCQDLETQCQLTVKAKPPRLVRGLQAQSVPMHTDVVMSVRLSKIVDGEARWSLNGTGTPELIPKTHTRIKMEQRGEMYTLTIQGATMAEDGIVEFELPIKDGPPIKSKAKLEIIKPKPAIEKGLQDETDGTEREDAEFRFTVCEREQIERVKWYHNGKLVEPSQKYIMTSNEVTGECFLLIKKCRKADAGVVEARVGLETTKTKFNVAEGAAMFTCARLQKMEIQCGQSVELVATVSRADAVVQWFKDDKEIDDPRISPKEDGLKRILHIDQVRYPGDTGNYSCVVGPSDAERVDIALEVQQAFETFLTKLPDQMEGLAGEDIVFAVEVSAPEVNVQWLKDGKLIKESDKMKLSGEGLWRRLTIRQLDCIDTSRISCETLHDKTQTAFNVNEPVITVVSDLEDNECIEGGTVSYELELSHTLRAQVPICWLRNAKPLVHDGDRCQISALAGGRYSVTLRRVQREEAGTINFVAGKIKLSAQLKVNLPPFKFTKGLSDVSVFIGESVVLFCEVNHPDHDVQWLMGNEVISSKNQHISITKEGVIHKLRIGSSLEADTAIFTVQSTDNPEIKLAAFVEVTQPPIEVIHPLEDLEIEEGDVAEFVFEISRKVPNVDFFLGNDRLIHIPGETEIEVEECLYRIYLHGLLEDDSGVIKAVIDGIKYSEAICDIIREPIHFKQPLRDCVVEMKNRCTMTCEISDPDAPVQWLFNDEPLIPDHNISAERSDTFRSLVFASAMPSLEGFYTCVTPDGRKTSAELFVQKPEVQFIEGLEDQEVYMGDSVQAKIRLSVVGAGGHWEWDNEKLESAPGRVEMYNEHEEYRIKLFDVQETGTLAFVVAKNCNSLCRITALERPIKFKRRLDDMRVDEGEDFTLECEMTVDKLKGFWTFEDEPIRESDRYVYEIDGTRHMLHIKGASYDCIGKYGFKCGKKFTFSAVTVKEIEVDILSGATDLQIKEGKQFCLSVVVSNPKASIQWRKDGRSLIGGEHFKFSKQVSGEKGGPPEGVRYMLEVERANISDEGLYTFDAQEGRATCTAKVHVKREPATVTKQLVARKIRDTEPFVEFVAEFSRPDIKVVWSRDNKVLRGDQYEINRISDVAWSLIIKEPTEAESGLYCAECEDCSSHAMLRVLPWKTQIIDQLEDQTGELNSKVNFTAAISLPSPANIKPDEIEWYFGGELVDFANDDRFSASVFDEYVHTFSILRTEEAMMNKQIALQVRDARTEATLVVYVPPSPPHHVRIVAAKHDWAILQWDEPQVLGSLPIIGYILECRVEDGKWSQFGPELILGTRTEVSELLGGVEHRFRVRAKTSFGIAAASVNTDPLVPWVPLSVSKHLEAETWCYEEEDKVLKCQFTLTEDQEPAEWYCESELIDFSTSTKFENVSDGHWRGLKIINAQLDDSGLYMCKIGEHSTETILEVEQKPPSFTVKVKGGQAELGDEWTFICETEKPDSNVVWLKNGMELPDVSRFVTRWDDNLTHTLTIKDIQEDDYGEYSAYIEGSDAITSAELIVETPEPKFTVKIQSAEVDVDNDWKFVCQTERPSANVIWLKNGVELPESRRFISESLNGLTHSLTIKNIGIDDQGEYSAYVEGSDAITSADLAVLIPAPFFSVQVKGGKVDLGKDWKFVCETARPNANVIWLKNGVELPDTDRFKTHWDEDLTHTLTIIDVEESDQAEYSAYIEGSDAITSAEIVVDMPHFEAELEPADVKVGGTHTFR